MLMLSDTFTLDKYVGAPEERGVKGHRMQILDRSPRSHQCMSDFSDLHVCLEEIIIHTYTHIHKYTHMHTYMYRCIHTYTHTYIHTSRSCAGMKRNGLL